MPKLSLSQRESLNSAVSRYHQSLEGSPAEEYLTQRGLSLSDVSKYRLGYVQDPLPEHTKYEGKLAIPYLRWHPRFGWGTVDIRFRALDDSKPKYQSMPGSRPRIYNTNALMDGGLEVGVCEGEIDAITLSLAGMPTAGFPGATTLQPHWLSLFEGYTRVNVFTDGDEAGEKFAQSIAKSLPTARVIRFPDGEDANSIYQEGGAEELRSYWIEEE